MSKKNPTLTEIIERLEKAKVPDFRIDFTRDEIQIWGFSDMAEVLPDISKYMLNGNYRIILKRRKV